MDVHTLSTSDVSDGVDMPVRDVETVWVLAAALVPFAGPAAAAAPSAARAAAPRRDVARLAVRSCEVGQTLYRV
jgi:hypothetical protein